ncbi:hypothetical protein F5Y14DRAFT_455704 [Nemania sp. NC0429]|nr:hypothetical protein F5Y14DRAFT_455704 [Nemania sp. NC0429]
MGDAGQYQGSQAFSHIVPQKNESVNPNTGSLNYQITLLDLRGSRPGIELSLKAFYSYGAAGTFGLPSNWSLDLPYVLDGKSVTANGYTYAIDFEWTDETGRASGLKYMNNHGISFEKITPPQNLPGGFPGQYGYLLNQVDGSKVYFDLKGKPLLKSDIYDNFIYYSYILGADGGVGSQHVLLDFIQDSLGQKITFEYQESHQWRINLPNGLYTTVILSPSDGILSVQDPADLTTTFVYVPAPGASNTKVLSTITYPTGLSSRYDWGVVSYLDAGGTTRSMPRVKNHYQLDSEDKLYSTVSYDLGGFTGGNTYTGGSIGLRMGGGTDTLMDGDGSALSYIQDDTEIARTTTYFNNYHLPVQQIKFSLDNHGQFVEAYQTTYEYDISIDKRARTTAYNYPKITKSFNNTSTTGDPAWHLITQTTDSYNEYGNLLTRESKLDVSGRGMVTQTTTTNEYVTTSRNIQLASTSIQRDDVTKSEERTVNTPTADGRSVASTTYSFVPGSGQQPKPWTKHTYGYDSQGRITQDTLSWAPGASVPDGTITTVTNTMAYSFQGGILTQTASDADKNATVIKYDMSKYGGPMMSKKLPLGQTELFEYDNICRLTKHTDALGHSTTTAYTVGPNGGTETVTSPNGYVKLTKYDVLGREIEVLDNGDPTKPTSANATRLLSRQKYDPLSRVEESTDNLGLVTHCTYDALSRPLKVTDPKQNVTNYKYDDVNLIIVQDLNGDIRSVTQLNGRTEALKVTTYPDSGDTQTGYFLETNNVYDGNKRTTSTTLVQKSNSAADVTLEKVDIEYGPQSTVSSRTVAGSADGGNDVVKRQFTYDLFGNTYTWVKDTTYANGKKYQVKGPINVYDNNSRLAVATNQLGQKEENHYDANGWLKSTVRYDKSEVKYTCDNVGRFITTTYPASSIVVTYDSDGHVTQVKDGSDTIKYDITLDGTLAKTTYSDGLTQVNTLDKYSRLATQTDVFGVARTTEYDDLGEIKRKLCKQDTVTYKYDTVNHSKGQYVGFELSGGRSYKNAIKYDGFSRIRSTTATDSSDKTLLSSTYTVDGKGKIVKVVTSSTVAPDLNVDRTIAYDGIGQVVSDSHPATSEGKLTYTYDGNSNILSTTTTGGTTTEMTYNKIDQRTDSGFAYDTLGRLSTDKDGRVYKFDERDRLFSVQAKDAASGFEYRADDYLAKRTGASDTIEMYYNSGKVNSLAVTKTSQATEKTSIFTGTKAILASYTDQKSSDYFFDSVNSTALLVGQDSSMSIKYDAYGEEKSSSTSSVGPSSNFGFGQEFYDATSELVYLRSRYYSPKIMGFISMDRNHQENRYAYCEGDPINNFDPLGESWEAVVGGTALVVGAVIGAVVTAGVGLAIEASLGAAVGAIGLSEVAAATASSVIGVAAASIGGAVGNVVGGYVSATLQGQDYTGMNALVDALTGAAGGSAGKMFEPTAKAWASTLTYGEKGLSKLAQEALVEGMTGAVNKGTQAIVRPILLGEPINPLKVGASMLMGFGVGVAKTYALDKVKVQYREVSPRVKAAARQWLGRVRAKIQAAKMKDIDIYAAGVVGLAAFGGLAGGLSGADNEVASLANYAVRPKFETLSLKSENLPPWISEI